MCCFQNAIHMLEGWFSMFQCVVKLINKRGAVQWVELLTLNRSVLCSSLIKVALMRNMYRWAEGPVDSYILSNFIDLLSMHT